MGENIEMDLKETEWQDVGWIGLTKDREKGQGIAKTVTKPRVPKNAGNFLTS